MRFGEDTSDGVKDAVDVMHRMTDDVREMIGLADDEVGTAVCLFRAELDDQTFAGGFYFHFAFGFGHQFAGVGDEGINFFVVVVGVVVKEDEFFDASLEREGDGVVHTAMTPAGVPDVFLAVVLGIEDEDVGVADEVNHVAVVAAFARFGVGKENDDALRRGQPVADGEAGMIRAMGADERGADGEIEIAQFLDLDVAGKFRKRHGEIGAFHLAGEGGDESLVRAFAAEDAEVAAGFVDGREERQALDVIPVRVGNEEGEIERLGLEFFQERDAELAQAGAGIEDDDVLAGADFDAGSIAAVVNGAASRSRDGAANTPKLYGRRAFDGATLA